MVVGNVLIDWLGGCWWATVGLAPVPKVSLPLVQCLFLTFIQLCKGRNSPLRHYQLHAGFPKAFVYLAKVFVCENQPAGWYL